VEWRGRIGPSDEVTVDEAAGLLHLPPKEVEDLVEAGALPARTNRSMIWISLGDIDVYRRRFDSPPVSRRTPPREAHLVVD
jgi:hypothetical protein